MENRTPQTKIFIFAEFRKFETFYFGIQMVCLLFEKSIGEVSYSIELEDEDEIGATARMCRANRTRTYLYAHAHTDTTYRSSISASEM